MKGIRRLALAASFMVAAFGCAAAPQGELRRLGSAETEPAARPMEARIETIVRALGSGDAAAFETAALQNFSAAFMARRSPAERAQLVERFRGDFGAIEMDDVRLNGDQASVTVRGETGVRGIFEFVFDRSPGQRVESMSLRVERFNDGPQAPPLPPLTIASTMSANEIAAALDAWIAPMVAADDFSGVILIARDGAAFVTRAYGLADRRTNAAADAATLFNIASISKKFTQTAVARLIQDGQLSLATTIGDVIPDYPHAEARAATIDQLVTMRGGISDFFGPAFEAAPKAQFASNHAYYQFVSALPQRFAPGARQEYCNGCYIVLGEIIERVSGMRFEDYVARHVFTPAGMTRTGYHRMDNRPPNSATPYTRLRGQGSAPEDASRMYGATGSGAGGAFSSAEDLLAFDNALRGARLLNPEMTAWVLGGSAMSNGHFVAPMGVAGGTVGANAVIESDGVWTIIVTANVDPETPERVGQAIAQRLSR